MVVEGGGVGGVLGGVGVWGLRVVKGELRKTWVRYDGMVV